MTMKKRIILPVVTAILLLVIVGAFVYIQSFVGKTIENVERSLSRRFMTDVDIDAGVSFFPPSLSINELVFKKENREAFRLSSCYSDELLDMVKNDKFKLNLKCGTSRADLSMIYDLFRSIKKSSAKKTGDGSGGRSVEADIEINELSVVYGDIREDFSLSMNYSDGEGVLRLRNLQTSRSKGYVEILFSIPERKADTRFEKIELISFSKLIAEMSQIDFLEGKMSGTLNLLEKDGDVFSDSDIVISDFSIIHPLVDTEKFSIPFLRFVGKAVVKVDDREVEVGSARISLGGIDGMLSGRYSGRSRSFDLDLKKVELNRLEKVVRNDAFKGYLFDGHIDLEVKYRWDEELGKSFSLIGNVIEPKQLSKRLSYLNLPFKYSFTDAAGKTRAFFVGPGNVDYTDLSSIPDHLKWAVIVSEDAGFYVHQGIDFKEIDAAVKDNMTKKKFRGGSTITQQLAKNLFLKRKKTMLRKLREAILAVEIDATLSKRRQLEIYLNIIEWGPGIFGVSEASWYYFGKIPMDLTPLESAYLASIIPGPNKYNFQFRKKEISEKWLKKLHHILGLMNETGHLDLGDYYGALADDLIFRKD